MAVNKVVLGDQTLIDLTADSVTPDKLFKGITAHNMKGESIVGTMEGGSTPSEPTDNTAVIFADYDGNLIDTWTKDEVASKTALPTPPAHSGLVFEGWNWTLEDIQTDTTGQVITVGPYYHTESGLTEIDIHLDEVTGKFFTCFSNSINVDWGDGTSDKLMTHTYADYGDYTIKTSASSISFDYIVNNASASVGTFIKQIRLGVSAKTILINSQEVLNGVTVHSQVTKIAVQWNDFIGSKTLVVPSMADCRITTGINTDYICYPKQVGTMMVDSSPDTGCGTYNGRNMKFFYMPLNNNVTSIGNSAFSNCSSLQSITIPENVTSIGNSAFYNCSSLQSITIPENVTLIENSAFSNCSSLQSITIPENVTSIGSYAFYNCSSLQSITIPENVTSIESQAFSNWYGGIMVCSSSTNISSNSYAANKQTLYDFSGCKSIPVLSSTSSLTTNVGITTIYVPLSLYYEWKEATNWATYASKIQPKGEGIGAFNGVGKLTYNEATTLVANYVSETEPTNITITVSNPNALEIGQYTIDNEAKTITIPVTAKNVSDTVTVTLTATFGESVQSRTLSIKIKESFKTPSFTVTDVEGASYNFVLNDAGYYESTNKKVINSAALCKLNITDLEDTTKIIFDCINSGEANYDYGMISKINTTLGTTNNEDSASNLFVSFKGQSSTNVVSKSYPVSAVAACYFTLKYRKDSSGDQGNDSLQFKVRFE